MKYKLNKNNNSKKIMIGVSILFCTVILIIGTSLAYFTQSDSKELGNIVSSNDNNVYINYIEEKSMMFDNLIPLKNEDVYSAIDSGCVDNNGFNVCSSYIFSLENTYGGVQKININMIPTANSFTNLRYMVAKMGTDGMPTFITDEPLPLEKNNLNPITLIENEILFSGQENVGTYGILFYIESMNYDQTEEDAGKHFGATIKIDSITTGKYIVKSFGDSCWDLELIDGTIDEYKLTEFKGIENAIIYDSETGQSILGEDKGSVKEECSMYVSKDENDGYYTINIPSSVGGYKITTLGNGLFTAFELYYNLSGELAAKAVNSYRYIKKIVISEGIKIFEDSNTDSINGGVFSGIGMDEKLEQPIDGFEIEIMLPSTLEYIGYGSMFFVADEFVIPKNVKQIGSANGGRIFMDLKKITFEGADDNTSKLVYIGDGAFRDDSLDYQDEDYPLIIPSSVKYIGKKAFSSNSNLKFIKYKGNYLDSFDSSWYDLDNTTLITE